jgi:hypothetical protein
MTTIENMLADVETAESRYPGASGVSLNLCTYIRSLILEVAHRDRQIDLLQKQLDFAQAMLMKNAPRPTADPNQPISRGIRPH